MHFHPQFDALYFRNDFLFLQLNGTVQGVKPVTLNFDDNLPVLGNPLTVVGWGLTNPLDSTAYPNVLQQVDVSYISNNDCERTTSKGQSLYDGYIFDDMLCAWSKFLSLSQNLLGFVHMRSIWGCRCSSHCFISFSHNPQREAKTPVLEIQGVLC